MDTPESAPTSDAGSTSSRRPDRELALDVAQPYPGVVLISATGEVDEANVGRLEDFLDSRLTTHLSAIALDLTRVSFLGIAGLDMLRGAQVRAAQLGVNVHLVVTNYEVLRALRAAGLTEVLSVHDTVRSAVEQFSHPDGNA